MFFYFSFQGIALGFGALIDDVTHRALLVKLIQRRLQLMTDAVYFGKIWLNFLNKSLQQNCLQNIRFRFRLTAVAKPC